jgi:predicted Zn finger-like uncharacterized protein
MIVECPSCARKYKFDDSILASGRIKVRCRACGHVWVLDAKSRQSGASGVAKSDSVSGTAIEIEQPETDGFGAAPMTAPETVFPQTAPLAAAESALRLRVLIAALGENAHPPWWPTMFLSKTGLNYLERICPRTVFPAAARACSVAAASVHDRSVGRVGVYHLFRLPELLEIDLAALLTEEVGTRLEAELKPLLGNVQGLISLLRETCKDHEEQVSGPIRIGSASQLFRSEVYRRMASIYWGAFGKGTKAFPYLEAE